MRAEQIKLTTAAGFTVLMAATGLPAGLAVAQEGRADVLEEIVVTARKREESLLEIPDSVSAISGTAIERGRIIGLEDIGHVTPNLSLSTRADGFPNVAIRGVGSFGNTQGVGFYLDDVQLFSDASSRFGDLERIEVLKGPQGTLYGGSNIGGAVRFITARPDAEKFSGNVQGLAGGQSIREFETNLNVPLADSSWAIRFFGFTAADDGYHVNSNPMRVNGGVGTGDRDIGQRDESGFRVSVAGHLSDPLSVFATVRWNEFSGPNNLWTIEFDQDFDYPTEIDRSISPRHDRETYSGSLEFNYDFAWFILTSVSSFTDTETDRQTDIDVTEEFIVGLFRPQRFDVFTQELRLTSTGEGPFEWLAGLYHIDLDEEMTSELFIYDAADALGAGMIPTAEQETTALALPFEFRDRNRKQYAAFVNTSYRFGDLEIGAGARVDRWRVFTRNRASNINGVQEEIEFVPRASLSYFLSESGSNVYATVSQGFEPGGFNLTNFAGSNELFGFNAEEATNFELGYKGDILDGRVTLTLAAFMIDYQDRQFELQTADPVTGDIVEGILNAGNSEQYGAEFDLQWAVNERLNISLGGGFVEAEWDAGSILGDGTDISGLTPPFMQESSLVFVADYEQPTNYDLTFIGRLQVSDNGRFETDLANTFHNPGYTIANLHLGIARENWELGLNIENLFDEKYHTDTTVWPNFSPLIAQPLFIIATLGQPRLVTGSVTVRF
ncbi:MAG: TonB-dependent receptor [Woeseia sp.]